MPSSRRFHVSVATAESQRVVSYLFLDPFQLDEYPLFILELFNVMQHTPFQFDDDTGRSAHPLLNREYFHHPWRLFSAPHFNGGYCGAAWKGAREDFSGCRGRQTLIQPPPQADILIRGREGPQFNYARCVVQYLSDKADFGLMPDEKPSGAAHLGLQCLHRRVRQTEQGLRLRA